MVPVRSKDRAPEARTLRSGAVLVYEDFQVLGGHRARAWSNGPSRPHSTALGAGAEVVGTARAWRSGRVAVLGRCCSGLGLCMSHWAALRPGLGVASSWGRGDRPGTPTSPRKLMFWTRCGLWNQRVNFVSLLFLFSLLHNSSS